MTISFSVVLYKKLIFKSHFILIPSPSAILPPSCLSSMTSHQTPPETSTCLQVTGVCRTTGEASPDSPFSLFYCFHKDPLFRTVQFSKSSIFQEGKQDFIVEGRRKRRTAQFSDFCASGWTCSPVPLTRKYVTCDVSYGHLKAARLHTRVHYLSWSVFVGGHFGVM